MALTKHCNVCNVLVIALGAFVAETLGVCAKVGLPQQQCLIVLTPVILVSVVLQIFIKMMAFSSFRSLSGPKMSNQEGREGWGRWRGGGGGWGGMQHVILSQPLINK